MNVSSGTSIALKDIIEFCRNYLHSASEVHYGALPYRENEAMDLRCDVGKMRGILGDKSSIDANNMIINYIDSKI